MVPCEAPSWSRRSRDPAGHVYSVTPSVEVFLEAVLCEPLGASAPGDSLPPTFGSPDPLGVRFVRRVAQDSWIGSEDGGTGESLSCHIDWCVSISGCLCHVAPPCAESSLMFLLLLQGETAGSPGMQGVSKVRGGGRLWGFPDRNTPVWHRMSPKAFHGPDDILCLSLAFIHAVWQGKANSSRAEVVGLRPSVRVGGGIFTRQGHGRQRVPFRGSS